MILAGRAANVAGVPVVLDPVGVGSTVLRTDSARLILGQVSVAIVRGNAAEAATLAGQSADIRGVESMGTTGDLGTLAGTAARVLGCIVAVTGPVDAVSDVTPPPCALPTDIRCWRRSAAPAASRRRSPAAS